MLGINKILAFVRRQVGLRTDTASATGSLHAKVKQLSDVVGDTADLRVDNTVLGWLNTPIKSIQRGTTVISNAGYSATATISAVNTSKSIVIFSGQSGPNAGGTDPTACLVRAVLTNTTTITFTRGYPQGDITSAWQIIEYY